MLDFQNQFTFQKYDNGTIFESNDFLSVID